MWSRLRRRLCECAAHSLAALTVVFTVRMSGTYTRCPKCSMEQAVPKRTALKAKMAAGGAVGGAVSGAVVGATYGTGAGIASGGTAMAATLPLGVIGGVVGGVVLGTAGKLGADWASANVTCKGCGHKHRI